MDISSFLEAAFPSQDGSNSSDASPTGLAGFSPTTLLETFVPGYGPIHKFILHSFGFDVTILVSLGACLWLSVRTYRYVYDKVDNLISDYYMSKVTIEFEDDIYDHLIIFLALQYKIRSCRKLTARTLRSWEVEEEAKRAGTETAVVAEENDKWLNFSDQKTKAEPRFTPAKGTHDFWYRGTYFQVKRKEEKHTDNWGRVTEQGSLTLICFGRSTEPIKTLIRDSREYYHKGNTGKTVIKRPWGEGYWTTIARRPSRPMNTVVLDEDSKLDVLVDINEYLSPATASWYSNLGIPYRRGYLFHGPPGTGKTSLTFALAGVFGLDIYVISLLEPSLTEKELGMLFRNLPARCIVLLEDIDTAGLDREDDKKTVPKIPKATEEKLNKEANVVEALTKAITRANQKPEEELKNARISLSGLLNVIDGNRPPPPPPPFSRSLYPIIFNWYKMLTQNRSRLPRVSLTSKSDCCLFLEAESL
jgi:chaperone BCS1